MKKIPTLFKREWKGDKVVGITSAITEGMEWVLAGEGEATVKFDGSCCAIINGEFYKRYDAKKGRKVPEGAIPCCEADPITGHHPHWVKVDENNPADKWFIEAYRCSPFQTEGTFEAIGTHFQGNPHKMNGDILIKHGSVKVEVKRTFQGIMDFLLSHYIEGLVFWKDGEPQCKIKRTDFGFEWNGRK